MRTFCGHQAVPPESHFAGLRQCDLAWGGWCRADQARIGIYDEDILNAVRHHTTGAIYMSPLEQIIYTADYIEPARDFPGSTMHGISG